MDAKKRIAVSTALFGFSLSALVLFANQLGLDNNASWGFKRYAVFAFGIFIVTISLFYRRDNFIGKLIHTEDGRLLMGLGIVCAGVFVLYIWFATTGTWISIAPTSNYYDMQAQAFREGQLHLLAEPDPALLAIENPYDPANREDIPILWDVTLYNSKYYLYWGPVPALALLIIKPFYAGEIGDNLITIFFLGGLFLFQTAIILNLYKSYFSTLHPILVYGAVVLVGITNPILYMLIEPHVYDAAVAGGQFFFIGGLFFLFKFFDNQKPFNLALAGAFFAFAVGSRTVTALPVAVLSLIVLFWAYQNHRAVFFKQVAAFAIPLALGAITYCGYNYARFGSFTEFGYSYQLTGFNIHEKIDQTFSAAYIPPNIFKILFNPFEVYNVFPFVRAAPWGASDAWFYLYAPGIYYYIADATTGLFAASPILLMAFIKKKKETFWISISLTGSTLAVLFSALTFFYAAMRYLLDMSPALALLTILSIWSGFELLKTKNTAYRLYSWAVGSLWIYTVMLGFLLGLSSNIRRVKEINPDMLEGWIKFFEGLMN